jgi:hypothetical protein
MKMSAEPECYLEGVRHRRGAWSVGVSRCAVICGGLSRLRSAAESTLGVESAIGLDRVASIGAQLRSASVPEPVGDSLFAGQRGVGVKGRFRMRRLRMCWSIQSPNNSFEPTLITPAPSLRVSSGAAQLNR